MSKSFNFSGQGVLLKKMSNYLLSAILVALVIFMLSYFFHTGAGLVAELIVSVELPETELTNK